jgi:hypothetical protein
MTAEPPTSRSEVLSPAPAMRVVFGVVALFFCGGFGYNLARWSQGSIEWTPAWRLGMPVMGVLAIATLVGAVSAWRNKVWIDHDRNELHQYVVLRDVCVSLDAPTTVELGYTPPALGSTVTGTWKVVVARPGTVAMSISTPWVRDIADVLRILQPSLARNPDLPADEHTRSCIEDPADLTPPPRQTKSA